MDMSCCQCVASIRKSRGSQVQKQVVSQIQKSILEAWRVLLLRKSYSMQSSH